MKRERKTITMPERENKSGSATAGTSLVSVLQIIFVVLKLTDNKVIGEWPWWKVMLPLIISASLSVFLCCCGVLCICVGTSLNETQEEEKDIPDITMITTNMEKDPDIEIGK